MCSCCCLGCAFAQIPSSDLSSAGTSTGKPSCAWTQALLLHTLRTPGKSSEHFGNLEWNTPVLWTEVSPLLSWDLHR